MAQPGHSRDSEEAHSSVKRKRDSSEDDDLENMPPVKKSMLSEEEHEESTHIVVSESSSCSSDEEDPQNDIPARNTYADLDYDPNSFLSPPSIPELPNCVLSPLENVGRGEFTPHSNKRQSKHETPSSMKRKCPLPHLCWGDSKDVWRELCTSDAKAAKLRNPQMFDNHPTLQIRMRAILLDWLNEVCEVYKMHRETFHLTVDYIDRYLTNTVNMPKGRLQLMGITCLFIAAKVEEVYPPKIGDFAFVTDGACSTDEILLQELHVMSVLAWHVTPVTLNGWLNVYIQVASEGRSARRRLVGESEAGADAVRGYTFTFPQYSSLEYVICGQLLDLAVLHVDVNRFEYGVVAAAVVAHIYNRELALRVSGLRWEALAPCYTWLSAAAAVLREAGVAETAVVRGAGPGEGWGEGGLAALCPDLNTDDAHRRQVHTVTLDMFDKVYELQGDHSDPGEGDETGEGEAVPGPGVEEEKTVALQHTFPLTPPQSDQKSPPSAAGHDAPHTPHTPLALPHIN